MEVISNQLYCMDCMELFPQLPDGCVSLILTDPPYGIRYQNNFTKCQHPPIDGDSGIDYERFARESYRILQDNAHAYFFTRFDCYPYHYDCLMQAGFSIKNCLVVEKGTIGGIEICRAAMPTMRSGSCSVRKEGGYSTIPRCYRTRKRREPGLMLAGNLARNTKPGSIPAGLGRNTPKQLTIPFGRKNTRFTIRPLKMRNFCPG